MIVDANGNERVSQHVCQNCGAFCHIKLSATCSGKQYFIEQYVKCICCNAYLCSVGCAKKHLDNFNHGNIITVGGDSFEGRDL